MRDRFDVQRKLKKLEILERLEAMGGKDMDFSKAMELAMTYSDYFMKEAIQMNAIMVLCETVIGISHDGYMQDVVLKDGTPIKDARPCIRWALEQVVDIHVHVACDPFEGMEKYLDRLDTEVQPKNTHPVWRNEEE